MLKGSVPQHWQTWSVLSEGGRKARVGKAEKKAGVGWGEGRKVEARVLKSEKYPGKGQREGRPKGILNQKMFNI